MQQDPYLPPQNDENDHQPSSNAAPKNDPKTPPNSNTNSVEDEKTIAAVAHGLSFIEGGIIGPLVVYLWKKDESDFIAFHALQSLYFGLLSIPLALVTLGLWVFPYLVFEALAALKSYEGHWYRLPIVGKHVARKYNAPS